MTTGKERIRIRASSVPILLAIDQSIRSCNIRGPIERFRDVAADSLDGLVLRCELDDLVRRGLLKIVHQGFDDSMGRDPRRANDPALCGTSWSVDPSEKLIRALWSDRVTGGGKR